MPESCGTCTHYTPDPVDSGAPAWTLAGFGRCNELRKVEQSDSSRVSEWPWGCRFTPSRYDGPDKNAVTPQVEGTLNTGFPEAGNNDRADAGPSSDRPPAAVAAKDDPPPFELT